MNRSDSELRRSCPMHVRALAGDLEAFYGAGGALLLWDDKDAWNLRREAEGSFYFRLLSQRGARSLIDVAAASGFHAIELASAGFEIVAIDGFPGFVIAGQVNQIAAGVSFPFILSKWQDLTHALLASEQAVPSWDAALCLGGSLHHAESALIASLFQKVHGLLKTGGAFIVEQRNYERLLRERPTESTHPGGWRYLMEYAGSSDIFFRLIDEKRNIDVQFRGVITLERELLEIAKACKFRIESTFFDHGKTALRDFAEWIEYLFVAE